MNSLGVSMGAQGIERDIGAEQTIRAQQLGYQTALAQAEREAAARKQMAAMGPGADVNARIQALVDAGDYKSANTLAQMQQRQGAAAKSEADIGNMEREQMYKSAEVVANAFNGVDTSNPAAVAPILNSLYGMEVIDDDDISQIYSDPNALPTMIQGATDALEARRLELSEESGVRGDKQLAIDEAKLAAEWGVAPNYSGIGSQAPVQAAGGAQVSGAPTAPVARQRQAGGQSVRQAQVISPAQQAEDLTPEKIKPRSAFPGGREGERMYNDHRKEVRENNKYKNQRRDAIRELKFEKKRFEGIVRGMRKKKNVVVTTANKIKDILKKGGILPKVGYGAGAAALLPGDAYKIERLLKTIEANVGFGELQEMRNTSKTGGAVGNLSEQEFTNLASVLGNIEIENPYLGDVLDTVIASYENAVTFLEDDLADWDNITAEFLPGGMPEQRAEPEISATETFTDENGIPYVNIDGTWYKQSGN